MELRERFLDEGSTSRVKYVGAQENGKRAIKTNGYIHPSLILLLGPRKIQRYTAFPADSFVVVAVAVIQGSLLR